MRTGTKTLFLAMALASTVVAWSQDVQTVSGNVVAVDTRAATLTVRPETASLEPTANVVLKIEDQTKLRKAGLKIKLQDVRVGDTVTATFHMMYRNNVALAVMVETIGHAQLIQSARTST